MSLDFAILPVSDEFLSAAQDIQTQLKNKVKIDINISIDTDYSVFLTTRINKWKKDEYGIITIDNNYRQFNSIIVIFSDKRTRGKHMKVDEFIELIASFEDDNICDNKRNYDSKMDDQNNGEGGCIIM